MRPTLALACLFVFACSDSTPKRSPTPPRTSERAAQRADESTEEAAPDSDTPVDETGDPGTIRGVALFDGVAPEPKPLTGPATTAGCAKHETPPVIERILVEDGKIQNVFVRIRSGERGKVIPPVPAEPVVLDQHGCVYVPHVSGMRAGQKLLVKNDDQATHNVNCRPNRNDGFNQSQPPGGAPLEWTPEHAEVMVTFTCDIHPWMRAYVGVVDHPWFAVTDASGAYTIANVPPGRYTLEAWHEVFGKKTTQVTVPSGGAVDVNFTFEEE